MKNFLGDKNVPISTVLNTKLPSTMLCLSGFELYSRWVPQAYCRYYQMNCNYWHVKIQLVTKFEKKSKLISYGVQSNLH